MTDRAELAEFRAYILNHIVALYTEQVEPDARVASPQRALVENQVITHCINHVFETIDLDRQSHGVRSGFSDDIDPAQAGAGFMTQMRRGLFGLTRRDREAIEADQNEAMRIATEVRRNEYRMGLEELLVDHAFRAAVTEALHMDPCDRPMPAY